MVKYNANHQGDVPTIRFYLSLIEESRDPPFQTFSRSRNMLILIPCLLLIENQESVLFNSEVRVLCIFNSKVRVLSLPHRLIFKCC